VKLPSVQGGQSLVARLSFRSKLLLVLFVPFLALVVVAAAGLSDRFTALHAQQQYGDLSGPLHSLGQASRALQNESVVSSWYAGSGGAPAVELQQARARTDVAVKQFRADEQTFADAGLSQTAFAALAATNKGFDQIPATRAEIEARTANATNAREFFLGVDQHLLDFGERAARDLASDDVAASLTRVFSLEQAQHDMARQASVWIAVLSSGAPQEFNEWVGAQAAEAQHLAAFANTATPDELASFDAVKGAELTTDPLPTAFPAITQTPGEYYVGYESQTKVFDHAIDAVTDVVNRTASAHADAAMHDVRVYGGAAVFAMLLTLLLIWFVSRAVVTPVRRLTAAAREMSQRQLPALVESLRTGGDVGAVQPVHIEVSSEDEIGELAQAFNDVEAVTFEVAQEQARLLRKGMGDLFVNLARRNQSLVQRQLELLDDLERNEHDPAALDALFKLDHMATRMRRNAESLLVLSGAEQPRQWQQPIALIDVVRSAAAEIADFPRVELVGIDDALAVSGRAVSDVAHLLAELLENATSFSPPDSAVVVSGAVSATGFVLAISDQGIGMTPERLADANRLLAEPPVVGLALARALGLHVVGSLAARHGIAVELRAGAPAGVVALVALPTAVLEPRPASAPPAAPSPDPVYQPLLDDEGRAEPLGARREVSRPPDEPPVEEWGRQGFGAAGPPSTPPEPTVEHLSYRAPDLDEPTAAPAPEPAAFDTSAFDTSAFDTSAFDTPASAGSESPEPLAHGTPFDVPPFAPSPFDASPPVYDVPTAHDEPLFAPPSFDAAPTAHDAPPAFDEPCTSDVPPVYDVPPFEPVPPSFEASESTGATEEPPLADDAPLPTRVPGQHLSHHPLVPNEPGRADSDPMRPYRVHELLTRHANGKRRGQMGAGAPGEVDAPNGDAPSSSAMPGSPGATREDGR
jgi:signal transduction histidine kinase